VQIGCTIDYAKELAGWECSKAVTKLVSTLSAEKTGFLGSQVPASDFVNGSEAEHSNGSNRDLQEQHEIHNEICVRPRWQRIVDLTKVVLLLAAG
jgi:hypothetical protein